MRTREYILAAALLAFIAGGIFYGPTPAVVQNVSKPVVYENPRGYSFTYSPPYRVNQYTPEYVTMADRSRSINADLAVIEIRTGASSRIEEAYELAKLACAADGPTGSERCAEVTRAERFRSRGGAEGHMFYLALVIKDKEGSESIREAGPFWAFPLLGEARAFVIIYPSYFGEESTRYEEGARLAFGAANSLVLHVSAR